MINSRLWKGGVQPCEFEERGHYIDLSGTMVRLRPS